MLEKEKDMTSDKTGSISEIGAKVGDIVECVHWKGDFYTEGKCYPVVNRYGCMQFSIGTLDILGEWKMVTKKELPYGHVQLPDGSTVDLLSQDVKSALINCKLIYQYFTNNGWKVIDIPYWVNTTTYRVKPQPKIETVTLDSADIRFKEFLRGATITFNLIDGVPDCNSIKMEKLK